MSLNYGQTIDDLLADSLIQTVMRADHVEPQALRTLMYDAAGRVAAGRRERGAERPSLLFVRSPADRRTTGRGANAPPPARRPARAPGDMCGSALCC